MGIFEGKISYEALESWCKAAYDHIKYLEENEHEMGREINYLYSFISWKHLSDEFEYFKENAHEEYDDNLPFPTLTL